jgi:hypothetical protein
VKDQDFLSDAEIGRSEIDLEDRFFGKDWKQLVNKPLERRTLRLPGSKVNRGKLELWIDVLTKSEAAAKPRVPSPLNEFLSTDLFCIEILYCCGVSSSFECSFTGAGRHQQPTAS